MPEEDIDKNYTPHILVARLSSLGDIILTSPVYRNIKDKWPNSKISVLVKPQFAQALAGNPHIDAIIPFQGIWHTLRIINQKEITHFLDLHATLRTFLISFFSNIPYKSRYKKDSMARRLFVRFGIPSPKLQRHVLDRYLQALAAWDIPIKYRDMELKDLNYYQKNRNQKPCAARICIFQTAFLGDTVLTAPLIKKTAELFPNAEIAVVTRPETVEIFKPLKEISEIIVDDKKSLPLIKGISTVAAKLRVRHFDIIICPHRSLRSALIAYLSKAPVRVGFSSSAGKFFYNRVVQFSWLLHDTERNLSLLNALTPEDIAPAPVTFEENAKMLDDIKTRLEITGCYPNRPLIGIHPGSAWFTKRWPAERFAQVIRLLYKTTSARAIIIGGKGDYELGEEICKLSRTDAINWAGKTDLPELMALMPSLKLFITNDSGPMHIATAFNVPTVGIFGPTTKELGFFPYGKGHTVIEKDLACRPCALHGGKECPRSHFLCMRLITAEEVFETAYEKLCGKKFEWPKPAPKPVAATFKNPEPEAKVIAGAPQIVRIAPPAQYSAPVKKEKQAKPKYDKAFEDIPQEPHKSSVLDQTIRRTIRLGKEIAPQVMPETVPLKESALPPAEEKPLETIKKFPAPDLETDTKTEPPDAIPAEHAKYLPGYMQDSIRIEISKEALKKDSDGLRETLGTEEILKRSDFFAMRNTVYSVPVENSGKDYADELVSRETLGTEEILKRDFQAMRQTRYPASGKTESRKPENGSLHIKRRGFFEAVGDTLKAAGFLKNKNTQKDTRHSDKDNDA